MHWVVSYEPYNHTTVKPFKSNELMRVKYYDEIYCGEFNRFKARRVKIILWTIEESHVLYNL